MSCPLTARVRAAMQTADTTAHGKVVPLLEPGCEYTTKSYRCTANNELPVVPPVRGKVRRGDGRHNCSREVVPLLRPGCEFTMEQYIDVYTTPSADKTTKTK